ncbi:alpha/beta hydrolase [Novosphingobium sp. PASSN1]|uniref:alpha/beta hydrolase n=1 Tax=Novosphingobium sp. PASSN1 TaxID=2015561 RepID=UPI000BC60972|nr:alpha/beta hydrolase [Novosphingobium sp. PASSN1]OYU33597.1 MAG: alpha/beta hydrolase [Novosphingobium sp. PASSN1]
MIDPQCFAPWVSEEAREAFKTESDAPPAPRGDIAALRAHYDAFNRRHLEAALAHYPVAIERSAVGSVTVDIISSQDGARDDRTLICLHGGAFMWGRGAGALLEAVPVAAKLGVRVVAVEYALAPEAVFPAAVNDVVAVFDALCRELPPSRIGIYGCSAGGVLTAQTTARLLRDGKPLPGAIAMLCGTGLEMTGDSAMSAGPLNGEPASAAPNLAALPYFSGCEARDPLVFPGNHPDVLADFPPSLLVTGTRDFAASSVATMHRRLLAARAEAELLLFDGMGHAFHMATTLPEARETFAAMSRFFGRHLR